MSTIKSKRQLANGISAFAVAAALLVATPAYAQSDTATLQGESRARSAGTQVVATDNNTGRKVTGTVDATGNYTILGLTPGDVHSRRSKAAMRSKTTLLVGQTAIVDFVPPSADRRGRRSRRHWPPFARGSHCRPSSTNITPAQIENLPQNKRNFLSFAALAPGVHGHPGRRTRRSRRARSRRSSPTSSSTG